MKETKLTYELKENIFGEEKGVIIRNVDNSSRFTFPYRIRSKRRFLEQTIFLGSSSDWEKAKVKEILGIIRDHMIDLGWIPSEWEE